MTSRVIVGVAVVIAVAACGSEDTSADQCDAGRGAGYPAADERCAPIGVNERYSDGEIPRFVPLAVSIEGNVAYVDFLTGVGAEDSPETPFFCAEMLRYRVDLVGGTSSLALDYCVSESWVASVAERIEEGPGWQTLLACAVDEETGVEVRAISAGELQYRCEPSDDVARCHHSDRPAIRVTSRSTGELLFERFIRRPDVRCNRSQVEGSWSGECGAYCSSSCFCMDTEATIASDGVCYRAPP